MKLQHHLGWGFAFFLVSLLLGGHAASAITRDEVISRAQSWYDAKVPYSQSGYYPDPNPNIGFREDCSGYVYFCWNTKGPDPDYYTGTLPDITDPISPNDLKAGDILLNVKDEHVVLFDKWADDAHSHYWVYEEANPSLGTKHWSIPYPYWPYGTDGQDTHPENYQPRRYRQIVDGGTGNGTNIYVSTSGNDSNSGSSGSPLRTVKHAVDQASSTQSVTINIAPGTYGEKVSTSKHILFVTWGSGTVRIGG